MDPAPAPTPNTAPAHRSTAPSAWIIGAAVLGVVAIAAVVVVIAGILVLRGVEPSELGPDTTVLTGEPGTGGDAFAEARRCRAGAPVSMQIDFSAPAPTAEAAAATAQDQVARAYAVSTWTLVEQDENVGWWVGNAADASLLAVFDVERVGTGWVIGAIRRC